jgi:heme/copper-type cytochrome/quinol oxidase subunit 2
MQTSKRPTIAGKSVLLLLALAALLVPIPTFHAPQTHRISIDASQFEYSPGRLTVNRGDTLQVTLTASDVVHGFFLDGYEIDARVEPGISQQFTVLANRSGKFSYRCSVSCGPLHPFMIGELVVGPNEPLWRASAIAVIAAAAAMLIGAGTRRPA